VDSVRVERLDPDRHDRSAFCCDDPAVDGWLSQDAVADDRRAGVAVQVASDGGRVVGCYRLGSFQVRSAPSVWSPKVWDSDRMPVPAIIVSRLGVDQRWQRRGLGASLMWHALGVATSVAPALRARLVVAHAEPEAATGILGRLGFRAFDSDPRWGYLTMRDVEATISTGATETQGAKVADRPTPDR
jgi:GNAT superfamily N-acetyltransferase